MNETATMDQVVEPPAPVLAMSPLPRNLAQALGKAISAAGNVEKTAINEHFKYPYAPAESIIAEGRQALVGADLVMVPVATTLSKGPSDSPGTYLVDRTWMLSHAKSGESTTLAIAWPVVCERGRPLDKALAIALTGALAYLLRDLLLIARVLPSDDMNARIDEEAASTPARKPTEKAEKPTEKAEKPTEKAEKPKTPPKPVEEEAKPQPMGEVLEETVRSYLPDDLARDIEALAPDVDVSMDLFNRVHLFAVKVLNSKTAAVAVWNAVGIQSGQTPKAKHVRLIAHEMGQTLALRALANKEKAERAAKKSETEKTEKKES
jgi:hypothetical protein